MSAAKIIPGSRAWDAELPAPPAPGEHVCAAHAFIRGDDAWFGLAFEPATFWEADDAIRMLEGTIFTGGCARVVSRFQPEIDMSFATIAGSEDGLIVWHIESHAAKL